MSGYLMGGSDSGNPSSMSSQSQALFHKQKKFGAKVDTRLYYL